MTHLFDSFLFLIILGITLFMDLQILHMKVKLYKFQFNYTFLFFTFVFTIFNLGGVYHGKLKFPSEYPYKPPSIYMITPSGLILLYCYLFQEFI